MVVSVSTVLLHYKRPEIQEALAAFSKNREIVGSFKGEGFAKRPDVLTYPRDVLELVKQGVTSFHASEELWSDPLALSPDLKPHELMALRTGWDLVLDVDCPFWLLAKTTAWLIIKSLQELGVKSVSCKFSGNKGFHIGVPFAAFPKSVGGKDVREVFPEGPRKIAEFLVNYMSSKHTSVDGEVVSFGNSVHIPLLRIEEETKKSREEITLKICSSCGKKISPKKAVEEKFMFSCESCGFEEETPSYGLKNCSRCNFPVEAKSLAKPLCDCGSSKYNLKFNPLSVIEVDTILIASRHLFRMPYSLHEKSGLVTIPIDVNHVLDFEKSEASPDKVKVIGSFLQVVPDSVGECNVLFREAFDFKPNVEDDVVKDLEKKNFDSMQSAAPVDLFPPCIHNILKGLKDGRKRSLFTLVNFLTCCGWDYDDIEKLLVEWNKKNGEPLREVNIKGQVRYHKANKKKVLPPNCSSNMYYKDLQVCTPDGICPKIKNPVSYTRRKSFILQKQAEGELKKAGGQTGPRLTEEQKATRKAFRDKLKAEKKDIEDDDE